MRDGHEGAARSCTLVFAHVVGTRVAGVVCACVCAVPLCQHAAGSRQTGGATWPRATEQAAARWYLMREHIKYISDFLKLTRLIYSRDRHRVQHGNTYHHPHGTRRQKMKLHAASGVAITCYCWHEQHMCNLQAGRDPRSTLRGDMLSTNCSWRTLADGRRFKGGKSLTVHVVADVELTAHYSCQPMGRGLCSIKSRAAGAPRLSWPHRASRGRATARHVECWEL